MSQLPLAIRRAIREGKEITVDGLTIYPITVREMDEFNESRPAIEVMQSTFPVAYAVQPLLQALYEMDVVAPQNGGTPTGLLYRTVLFLTLSLRLSVGEELSERINSIEFLVERDNPRKLMALRFSQDGKQKEITPATYTKIRPILAAQNGLMLTDESANAELINAEAEVQSLDQLTIVPDFDRMLAAVAKHECCRKSDLMDWTIAEFNERFRVIGHELSYMICGIAEGGGAKWKDGNPHPHWCFDRAGRNRGLIAAGEFMGGKGLEAIRQAQAKEQN